MDRYEMMRRISDTLAEGEIVHITVTEARGRTLVQHYDVSRAGWNYVGHKWGGVGNVRTEYSMRCLSH